MLRRVKKELRLWEVFTDFKKMLFEKKFEEAQKYIS
jgi:hypothetical protein